MSRIGLKPIAVPAGVTVTAEGNSVTVKGPLGTLTENFSEHITINNEAGVITLARDSEEANVKALHGLTRALLANMVNGVATGFTKSLDIEGIGYRAEIKGKDLVMALGYSHPVVIAAPEGITFEVPNPNSILVKGFDKQLVGETAAIIRKKRPPEPYKGKGIRYTGERVRRKAGKTGK